MRGICPLVFIFMTLCGHASFSQELWSLSDCVDYALEHSLVLGEGKLDQEAAAIRARASKMLRWPGISGDASYNLSFGRQIDPTTNDFNNQQFESQNFSLSAGITLFNGGRINQMIRQRSIDVEVATLTQTQLMHNQSLEVARAYLQVLLATENATNARKSVELVVTQLEQIDKLISAGTRPKNERLVLVADIAQAEQALVTADNDVDQAYLSLRQSMQLDPGVKLMIERPLINLPNDYDIAAFSSEGIYQEAASWQPGIRAGELRKVQAEMEVAILRTGLLPTLTAGASIGSRFSSLARRQGDRVGSETIHQDILLNNEPVRLSVEQAIFSSNKVGYGGQLKENLDYGFGLGLSIPISNQGRTRSNIQLAELEVARAANVSLRDKNQLKADVALAVAGVKAGKEQYEAAQRTEEAMSSALHDAERQYNLGVINSLEYITAQNNHDQAKVELTVAKFDYLFRLKVLDFYSGKKIDM